MGLRVSKGQSIAARAFLSVLCLSAVCLGAGCGGNGQSSEYIPENGTKIGASVADVMGDWLEDPDVPDAQRAVLERVAAAGSMEALDYEQSWAKYRQCMTDLGYREIKLQKYPSGLYTEALHLAGTAQQESKYEEDRAQCMAEHVDYVQAAYAMLAGNPNLYEDSDEAIVDCLHREDLVAADYTASTFAEESARGEEDDYSFDIRDMKARSCLASNGHLTAFIGDDVEEHLW